MTGNVLLTVLCRGLATALVLAANILVARHLGPAQLGDYAIAMAMGALIVQFACLGMHVSNSYFLSQDQSLLNALVGNSVASSIVFGGAFTIALAAFWHVSDFMATSLTPVLFWLAAAMVPARLFMILGGSLLLGLNQAKSYNVSQIACSLLVLLAVGGACLLNARLPGFLWATLAAWGLAAGLLLVLLMRHNAWPPRIDLRVFRGSVGYMGKAYLICLLSFLIRRGNLFLLEHYSDDAEVGFYSIAAQGIDILHLGPASLALILFPKLVQNADQREQLTYRWLSRAAVLLLIAVAVSSLVAVPAVYVAYGSTYLPVVPALRWMLPSVLFSGLTSILSQYMAAAGYPKSVIAIWLLGFVLMICTGCYLIPKYGGVGAGSSLSLAYAFVFVLHLMFMRFMHGERRQLVPAI